MRTARRCANFEDAKENGCLVLATKNGVTALQKPADSDCQDQGLSMPSYLNFPTPVASLHFACHKSIIQESSAARSNSPVPTRTASCYNRKGEARLRRHRVKRPGRLASPYFIVTDNSIAMHCPEPRVGHLRRCPRRVIGCSRVQIDAS